MIRISVVGLGKLGLCTAACFAAKGFQTIGVDVDRLRVSAVNRGTAPFSEPRLQEILDRGRGYLTAGDDHRSAVEQADITFLIVPTPSKATGHFSNEFLKKALHPLSLALKESAKAFHRFVVTSTVSPGSIAGELIPLVEAVSGRRHSVGFSISYNPEFIALGSVIDDLLNPDMVLIGESDLRAGDDLETIYRTLCENDPLIARMSIISAEIAKISLNAYVTMKISFANTLANICEKIPGAQLDSITDALGADTRIGPRYLKGGWLTGGPCFPRDNRAFSAFAGHHGLEAQLATATDGVNRHQIRHLAHRVIATIERTNAASVAILGLAYKPGTPVVEESPALYLAKTLVEKKYAVTVYDPLAMAPARAILGKSVAYAASINDCLSHAGLCVLTTSDPAFLDRDLPAFKKRRMTIIDCWRLFPRLEGINNLNYISMGSHDQNVPEHQPK